MENSSLFNYTNCSAYTLETLQAVHTQREIRFLNIMTNCPERIISRVEAK